MDDNKTKDPLKEFKDLDQATAEFNKAVEEYLRLVEMGRIYYSIEKSKEKND